MQRGFERWPVRYSPKLVLPLIPDDGIVLKERTSFDFHPVRFASLRLMTFKKDLLQCQHCGIVGQFFYKERNFRSTGPYHLNLYGINLAGFEVLMTCDHVIPLSKGGTDCISNTQTLCTRCNGKKADSVLEGSLAHA